MPKPDEQAGKLGLVIALPSGQSRILPLGEAELTIGRAPICQIVLDDKLSSKQHALLQLQNGRYVITDLQSKNGTLVNGKKVRSHVLAIGDIVTIGKTQLRLAGEAEMRQDSETRHPTARFTTSGAVGAGSGGQSGGGVPRKALKALEKLAYALASADGELLFLNNLARMLSNVVICAETSIVIVEEESLKPILQVSHPPVSQDTDAELGLDEPTSIPAPIVQAALAAEGPVRITAPQVSGKVRVEMGAQEHSLIVPLRLGDRKLGFLLLERDARDEPFADDELLLASIAGAHVTSFLRVTL